MSRQHTLRSPECSRVACSAAAGNANFAAQPHGDVPVQRMVVITGASSGIGAATALLLAQQVRLAHCQLTQI